MTYIKHLLRKTFNIIWQCTFTAGYTRLRLSLNHAAKSIRSYLRTQKKAVLAYIDKKSWYIYYYKRESIRFWVSPFRALDAGLLSWALLLSYFLWQLLVLNWTFIFTIGAIVFFMLNHKYDSWEYWE